MNKTINILEMKGGQKFYYMVSGEGDAAQVYGFVMGKDDRVRPGTSGWWPTHCPEKAKDYAEFYYGETS